MATRVRKCASCGVMSNDARFEAGTVFQKIDSGKSYCPKCWPMEVATCHHCGKAYKKSKLKTVVIANKNEQGERISSKAVLMCETCRTEVYGVCAYCGISEEKTAMVHTTADEYYCAEHKSRVKRCYVCGGYTSGHSAVKIYDSKGNEPCVCRSHLEKAMCGNEPEKELLKNKSIIRCDECGSFFISDGSTKVINEMPDGETVIKNYCPGHYKALRMCSCGHRAYPTVSMNDEIVFSIARLSRIIKEGPENAEDTIDIDGVDLQAYTRHEMNVGYPGMGDSVVFDMSGMHLIRATSIPASEYNTPGQPRPGTVPQYIDEGKPAKQFLRNPGASMAERDKRARELFPYLMHLVDHGCDETGRICPECYRGASAETDSVFERARGLSYVNASHTYAPSRLMFHATGKEAEAMKASTDILFLGVELEVDDPRNSERILDTNAAAYKVYKKIGMKHAYIKRDGSLRNGFEQVTHPATLEYMLSQRERYESLLVVPKAEGFRSHDASTCGLHVHVNRLFYGYDKQKAAELGVLTELFWPELFIFSRRKGSSDASRWAKRLLTMGEQVRLMATDDIDGMINRWLDYDRIRDDRYRTLNLTNQKTMEFRIFRGTLNKTTFWATLQLVNNMVSLVKGIKKGDLLGLKWLDIIGFKEYPELTEYNGKLLGEGWDGKTRAKVLQATDEESVAYSNEIMVPDSIYKQGVRKITYATFRNGGKISESILSSYYPKLRENNKLFTERSKVEPSNGEIAVFNSGNELDLPDSSLLFIDSSAFGSIITDAELVSNVDKMMLRDAYVY